MLMTSLISINSSFPYGYVQKGLVLWIFLVINLSVTGQEASAYSFFIAGHTYGSPGTDNVGFHPPFKATFEYIRSHDNMQFGVLVGDIVSSDPTAEDWDEIDADLAQLGLPIYMAAGNHDIEDRDLFESRYGPTFYSFTFHNDLFVILDPNLDAWNISGLQLDFLKKVINEKYRSVNNIFVFFHQILWREDDNQFHSVMWNSAAGRKRSTNFWSEVMPIFENLPNEVVMFAGDLGARWASNVMYHHCKNVTFIATGMGDGKGDNIIIANVAEHKGVTYDLICIGDVERYCLGSLQDHTTGQCSERDKNELTAYPSPTFEWLTVKLQKNDPGVIELFDLSGKLIHYEKWSGSEQGIDLSKLQSGPYFLRVSTPSASYRQIISKI